MKKITTTELDLSSRWALTAEDVAALLAVRPDSVKHAHRVGLLKAVKIGKHLRYLPADVKRYLDSLGDATDAPEA